MSAAMSRRRVLGAAAGLLVLPLLAACPGQAPAQPATPVDEGGDTCDDVEDLFDPDEDDCGVGSDTRRTSAPRPRPTRTRTRRQ